MTPSTVTRSAWLPALLLCLPLAALVVILARAAVNIPCMDDYDAILVFLRHYVALHGVSKLSWLLTAQYNEYKLVFLHAAVAADYGLTHSVNFAVLSWAGNLFIPLTLAALWLLFRRLPGSLAQRLWLFLPAVLLFCALQYLETTDWAMAGLQNLTVLPFALLALLLVSGRRTLFALGCLALSLSVCCSASGFFAGLSGIVLLTIQRRWLRLLAWSLTTAGMALLYAVHYHAYTAAPPVSAAHGALYFGIGVLSFLGAALSNLWLSIALGVLLTAVMAWLLQRGWLRADPSTFSIALFVCVTAIGVAHGRYRLGIAAGTASRYRMYSLLLLCALYAAALRFAVPVGAWAHTRWRRLWAAFTVICALFCAASDYGAQWRLMQRKALLVRHLIEWERTPQALILVPDEQAAMHTPQWIAFRIRAQQTLPAALAAGQYQPPVTAQALLPKIPRLGTIR